ncbi:DUF1579 family protein [Undibacterium sp.]|uniref:DUF1579 family protein n=1 Tax=Undibacterium sp. TaxID=1914977 RepID=UPI002B99A635|nr:DUF1579 family protein [Undibacterium sp.]HTD02213.1 DUF1579 family protein [Undibacterium sp.]
MSAIFPHFSGQWAGSNHLFLSWQTDPEHVSDTRLSVTPVVSGHFLQFSYDWTHDGQLQQGVLLLGHDEEQNAASAAWGDSWHQDKKLMQCTGAVDSVGAVHLLGSFAAPPDQDWGWRIVLSPLSEAEMQVRMHVISPEGKEELAVRADYRRLTE